jgi:uncharacterized protein (UPF0276 family)
MIGIGWRHAHYGEVLERARAGRPLPVDFLEVHAENFFGEGGAAQAVLMQARAHHRVSLHGVGLSLGSACGLDPWHLDRLAALVARVEPDWVSDHASFARVSGPAGIHHAADLLPLPFSREALDVLCANVSRTQDHLRRTMLVENLSAYVRLPGDEMTEPEFLTALARRTGCGLLIDVNNVYVNALNEMRGVLGGSGDDSVSAEDLASAWIDAIACDRVGELHLAGHADLGDIVIDDHGARVCDAVWRLHEQAARRFGPVPTLIEWDTDVPPLDVLLEEAETARGNSARVLEESLACPD